MKHFNSSGMKPIALAGGLLLPALAQAHPGHGSMDGLTAGMVHPLMGWDHILAMLAVGIWAAQMGGRATWLVPASFIALMGLGGVLGGMTLPFVESGILASILVLGLLIAFAKRLPLGVSMALVGVFAMFHGQAHGAEMPAGASGILYGMGFIMATVALHAVGIFLAIGANRRAGMPAFRFAGFAIAISGLCFWLA